MYLVVSGDLNAKVSLKNHPIIIEIFRGGSYVSKV